MNQGIRRFIIDFFLFGRDDGLADSDSLLNKGIIDSTGVLELVARVEKTYAIKVQNDAAAGESRFNRCDCEIPGMEKAGFGF